MGFLSARIALFVGLVSVLAVRRLEAQEPDCPSCQPPYDVTVTPVFGYGVAAHPLGSGVIDSFQVSNTGLNTDTYTYACSSTGGVSCTSVTPSSSTIGSMSSQYIRVTYTLGIPGGTLKFNATGSWDIPAQDSGSYTVSANPTLTIVAPVRTGIRAVVATRQPVIRALLLPNGSPVSGGGTTLIWKHGISTDTVTKFKSGSFSMPRQNRGLIE